MALVKCATLLLLLQQTAWAANSSDSGNGTSPVKKGEMKPCTAVEMKAIVKMNLTAAEMKASIEAGKISCKPSGMSTDPWKSGSMPGMDGMKNCSMGEMLQFAGESKDEIAKLMKSGRVKCMPSMELPTLKDCSEAEVKAMRPIYAKDPSDEEQVMMIMNGTIACKPTPESMNLTNCTTAQFVEILKKAGKMPTGAEFGKMAMAGKVTCMPGPKTIPELPTCSAEESKKMMMEMMTGKGALAQLMSIMTGGGSAGGGMAGLMGMLLGMLGAMGGSTGGSINMGGGMNMGGGINMGNGINMGGGTGMGGGVGMGGGMGMGMTTGMPRPGMKEGVTTMPTGGSKSGMKEGMTTMPAGGSSKSGMKEAMTTAMPKSGMKEGMTTMPAGSSKSGMKEAMTTAMPKSNMPSVGMGMGREGTGSSSGDAMTAGMLIKYLELYTSGNFTCLPGSVVSQGDSAPERPSKEIKEKASKLLDGCKDSSCLMQAAKALSEAGGLSEKAQKTYLNQLAGNAAKDAAKDGVKDCLAPSKTDAQKKECFDAAKQKLGAATEALLGNRSDAVKAKVQERLAEEAARDALGDSFSSCLKGGSDKKACLSQVSADLAAAGLEGESPRNIRDNLLRNKLKEAAEDCSNSTCREAAKQAALAAGMEEREYASVKALGDIKAAAEIYANCQLAGTEESECAGMAKADWVASSGADATAFTDELAARVKKLGAAIVSGIPVKLVRLKRMLATVLVTASSCDSSLPSWFATQCLNRAKAKQSNAEGAKAKDCIIVDAKAQYSASVNVDATDDEIDTVSAHVASSFEDQTLGQASAARRLLSAARRLGTVDETYASQDVAECSEEDSACLKGEPSSSEAAGSGGSPTPAPAGGSPTPAPASTATTAAPSEQVAAGAMGRGLGLLAALAAASALQ